MKRGLLRWAWSFEGQTDCLAVRSFVPSLGGDVRHAWPTGEPHAVSLRGRPTIIRP